MGLIDRGFSMTKQVTQMIKGLAILFMVAHHVFGTVSAYEGTGTILRGGVVSFAATFKICVAIYAFITGYAYFFAQDKSYKYSLKKIWQLLEIYWLILFTIFIPIALAKGYQLTAWDFVVQLFGLLPNLNWYAWYVFFYVFIMLVLPICDKIFRRVESKSKYSWWINLVLLTAVPFVIEVILHSIPNYEEMTLVHDAFSCFIYFPSCLIGYYVAQFGLIPKIMSKFKATCYNCLISLLGIVIVLVVRYYLSSILGFLLDVIYVPFIILFANVIFTFLIEKNIKPMTWIFSLLGKYSTGIWFFHAVFYSTYVSDIFAPLLLWTNNILLVFLLCVTLSLIGSMFYQTAIKYLNKGCSVLFNKLRKVKE